MTKIYQESQMVLLSNKNPADDVQALFQIPKHRRYKGVRPSSTTLSLEVGVSSVKKNRILKPGQGSVQLIRLSAQNSSRVYFKGYNNGYPSKVEKLKQSSFNCQQCASKEDNTPTGTPYLKRTQIATITSSKSKMV